MALPTINAIWIGSDLGPIQAACLRSFLRVGHKVALHAYERPADLPDGIEMSDARALLPESRMFRDSTENSLAPFSDLLRYELLAQGRGVYVDCDVFAFKPIADEPYIFGWYGKVRGREARRINNSVLKLPPDCPVLAKLRGIRDGFVPPWYPLTRRLGLRLRRLAGQPVPLSKLGYQFAGPYALTYYLRRHRLEHHAKRADILHPALWGKADGSEKDFLFDPELELGDIIGPDTVTAHLYHRTIKLAAERGVPPGTPLARMMAMAGGETLPC